MSDLDEFLRHFTTIACANPRCADFGRPLHRGQRCACFAWTYDRPQFQYVIDTRRLLQFVGILASIIAACLLLLGIIGTVGPWLEHRNPPHHTSHR